MDNRVIKNKIKCHLYQRLVETAINNFGFATYAEIVYMDIADNRLDVWLDEIWRELENENMKDGRTLDEFIEDFKKREEQE